MTQADIPKARDIADATATGDFERIVALVEDVFYARIPFNRVLGLRRGETTPTHIVTRFDMRPELVGNFEFSILHGGVIAAAIDSTAGMMALIGMFRDADLSNPNALRERFSRIGTIDMRIDYLRPAEGDSFAVTARALRHGRRVAVVRADLENDAGDLIASGTCTYIVG